MDRLTLRQVQDALARPLERFAREASVKLAVLINRSGQVLAQQGFDQVFDLVGVASLAAGINASSRALANQLGEEQFEHLHHAGQRRQLFLGQFDSPAGELMLVTVFDDGSSVGLVRLFFEDFVMSVRKLPLLNGARPTSNAADFEAELESSLDRFFKDLIGS